MSARASSGSAACTRASVFVHSAPAAPPPFLLRYTQASTRHRCHISERRKSVSCYLRPPCSHLQQVTHLLATDVAVAGSVPMSRAHAWALGQDARRGGRGGDLGWQLSTAAEHLRQQPLRASPADCETCRLEHQADARICVIKVTGLPKGLWLEC